MEGYAVKLIHCSDLHLDSRMETHLSPQQAQTRRRELCTTFSRLVDYAVEQAVAVVLLAGDVFDTERISAQTVDFFLDAIARAPGIDFLYLRGNHDESRRAFAGRTLPENLKTFSDTWTTYRYGSLCVTGAEWTRENAWTLYDSLSLSPEDTNLVMLHGQISTQRGEELVSLPDLRGKHIHYLALGHLHSYQSAPLDETGTYCYCGCLEGRGFDECGEKGFVLLNVEGQTVQQTFIPFAQRTLHDLPVDLTGLSTVGELQRAMEQAAEGIPSRDLLKFTFQGSYTPETQKDLPFLTELFAPRFFSVRIKDESRLAIQQGSYAHDVSLKGEFVRLVLAADLPEDVRDHIICCGIQALSGEEITL